jgi:hypothetical protein
VLLERMTMPDQLPALHVWRTHPDPASLSAAEIHTQGLEILDVMRPEAVIENRLEERLPAVPGGGFIHPGLAAPELLADRVWTGRVRGLFLIEHDAAQVVENLLEREPQSGRQELRGAVSALWSRWLADTCERLGVASIEARPWETLEHRALRALNGP